TVQRLATLVSTHSSPPLAATKLLSCQSTAMRGSWAINSASVGDRSLFVMVGVPSESQRKPFVDGWMNWNDDAPCGKAKPRLIPPPAWTTTSSPLPYDVPEPVIKH